MARWLTRGMDAVAGAIIIACALASPAMAQFATSGPILPTERDATQTPRTVAANEYRDSYCARWSDGCLVCRRSTANAAPDCQPYGIPLSACMRQPVECQAVLKTVYRVCLSYTDGCNQCSGFGCTAMACSGIRTNYQCTTPRRTHYDDPNILKDDLSGHWRLTDPQGRTCELVFGFGIPLTARCLELGSPVTEIRNVAVLGTTLQLVRTGTNPPLPFDTTNLEALAGIGLARGYRLERVEPMPFFLSAWEGKWRLVTDGWGCDLFLSVHRRRLDPPGNGDILVPSGMSLSSACVSSANETKINLNYSGNKQVLLPIWKSWQVEGHEITFRDDLGGTTVFKIRGDRQWTAEVPLEGQSPLTIYLERARE